MDIQGQLKEIYDTQEVGSNGFKKRDIVVTTDEQYPQHLLIQFTQDKTSLLDNYSVGQSVEVSVNLRGREWVNAQGETKYFNTIHGWKIKSLGQGSGQPQQQHAGDEFLNMPADNLNPDDDDDLPF